MKKTKKIATLTVFLGLSAGCTTPGAMNSLNEQAQIVPMRDVSKLSETSVELLEIEKHKVAQQYSLETPGFLTQALFFNPVDMLKSIDNMLVEYFNERLSEAAKLKLREHPTLIHVTRNATIEAVALGRIYNFSYQSNNVNNYVDGLRHSLWNSLISLHASSSLNDSDALGWAKTFTDAYEEWPGNPLKEKRMDLHNNRVGRLVYRDERTTTETYFDWGEKQFKRRVRKKNSTEFYQTLRGKSASKIESHYEIDKASENTIVYYQ